VMSGAPAKPKSSEAPAPPLSDASDDRRRLLPWCSSADGDRLSAPIGASAQPPSNSASSPLSALVFKQAI